MERRPLLTAGLAAFVVLDLVLVVLALRSVAAPVPTGSSSSSSSSVTTSSPSASPTASRSASASASASPSPSASPSATAAAPSPATRAVAGGGGSVVWALDLGSCKDGATVHVSSDGGRTWSSHDAPGGATRLRPTSARAAFVVGADDRCRFRLWNTGDGGASWTSAQSAAAAWGRDPADSTLIHRPGGGPVTPCGDGTDVLDLAGLLGGSAAVVCGDGTLRATTDGGASWSTTTRAEGLAALSFTAPGEGAIAAVVPDCAGVRLFPVAEGKVGTARCVEVAAPPSGEVSLSVVDKAVWLAAGDVVLRGDSGDVGAATFAPAGSWPAG